MSSVEVVDVSYSYKTKYQRVEVLRHVCCQFQSGKMYSIIGESGSGKSTLLSLLAGLDLPDTGSIRINDKDISAINRDSLRKNTTATVYQSFNLFPLLTAIENVMYPMELKGCGSKESRKRAATYLENVGLSGRIFQQFPKMMSGGEQQRVAIARALATGGSILLADEPTGNLDSENEMKIIDIFKKAAHEHNFIVVIATHNLVIADVSDSVYRMKDGQLFLET